MFLSATLSRRARCHARCRRAGRPSARLHRTKAASDLWPGTVSPFVAFSQRCVRRAGSERLRPFSRSGSHSWWGSRASCMYARPTAGRRPQRPRWRITMGCRMDPSPGMTTTIAPALAVASAAQSQRRRPSHQRPRSSMRSATSAARTPTPHRLTGRRRSILARIRPDRLASSAPHAPTRINAGRRGQLTGRCRSTRAPTSHVVRIPFKKKSCREA